MKRIMCLLLCLLLLAPNFAIAEKVGITVDDYINIVKNDSANNIFLASAVRDYKNRKVFIIASLLDGTALAAGYSFKNSDIVEYISVSGGNKEAIVFLLSAMSDKADAQSRVDDVSTYINLLYADILGIISDEWSTAVQVNNYFLNIWTVGSGENGIRFLWCHKSSKLKNKTSADGLINSENYPLADVIAQLQDNASPPASGPSGNAELSSGQWTCPEHLAAGEYKVTANKVSNLFVYRVGSLIVNEVLDPADDDEIGRLVLKDGDRLEISGGKLQFVTFE